MSLIIYFLMIPLHTLKYRRFNDIYHYGSPKDLLYNLASLGAGLDGGSTPPSAVLVRYHARYEYGRFLTYHLSNFDPMAEILNE